jgi:energy-converting hydrogenase Eha subunit E
LAMCIFYVFGHFVGATGLSFLFLGYVHLLCLWAFCWRIGYV